MNTGWTPTTVEFRENQLLTETWSIDSVYFFSSVELVNNDLKLIVRRHLLLCDNIGPPERQ